MAQPDNTQTGGHIGGVSLASFLQMLEQERKSCTLNVNAGDIKGSIFFKDGHLIDSECEDLIGQEALYTLLSFETPTFMVTDAKKRLQRITQPLAHLLLQAATRIDENNSQSGTTDPPDKPAKTVPVQMNPATQHLVENILKIPKVKHYYLLNKQGKLVTQSSNNQKIGDFIAYCLMSGIQIRKSFNALGMHRIQLNLETEEVLLITPGAGMIIGLLLEEHASIQDVTTRLRSVMVDK